MGRVTGDHPRSRGENVIFMLDEIQIEGSPPLTRGKQGFDVSRDTDTRITPAHAGKT